MTLAHGTIYASDAGELDVNRHALGLVRYFAFDAASLVLQFSLSSLLFGELDTFVQVTILIYDNRCLDGSLSFIYIPALVSTPSPRCLLEVVLTQYPNI